MLDKESHCLFTNKSRQFAKPMAAPADFAFPLLAAPLSNHQSNLSTSDDYCGEFLTLCPSTRFGATSFAIRHVW